jgi:hypothetical protein
MGYVERDLRHTGVEASAWQITTRANTRKTRNLTPRAKAPSSARETRRSAEASAAAGRQAPGRARRRARHPRAPARSSAPLAAPVAHRRLPRVADRRPAPPGLEKDRHPGALRPARGRVPLGLARLEPEQRRGHAAARHGASRARVLAPPGRARSVSDSASARRDNRHWNHVRAEQAYDLQGRAPTLVHGADVSPTRASATCVSPRAEVRQCALPDNHEQRPAVTRSAPGFLGHLFQEGQ